MKKLVTLAAVGCAAAAIAAPAFGSGSQPGTPGTASCHGQTIAYLAQLGKTAGVQDARGLGQLSQYETANYSPLSVQDIQQIAYDYCGS